MTTAYRTIAPAVFLVSLIASQAAVWAGDKPEWMPGGSLMTELRASGTNVGFVPGDAFFPIRIEDSQSFTEAIPFFTDRLVPGILEEQELSDDPHKNFVEYDYQYPDMVETDQPARLGFSHARVFNLTKEDGKILREFHGCVFYEQEAISADEGKPFAWGDVEGKPQIAIVIVNRDFDFKKYHPFVRYNENWNDEEPKFPIKIANFSNKAYGMWPQLYRPHVVTAEAVLEDWQNGSRVPPLKITLPEPVERPPIKIMPRIEIDFRDVALVGYPTADIHKIFTRHLNSTFYVATHEGVHRYRWIYATKAVERKLINELVYQPEE